MPAPTIRFEPTPNPNAVKCVVEPGPGAIRSYFRPEQAAGDELGEALFAIEGVTNVLIHEGFVSVGKRPDAAWGPIRRGIVGAIERTLGAQE